MAEIEWSRPVSVETDASLSLTPYKRKARLGWQFAISNELGLIGVF